MGKNLGLLVVGVIAVLLAVFFWQNHQADEQGNPGSQPSLGEAATSNTSTQTESEARALELEQLELDLAEADAAVAQAEVQLDRLAQQLDLSEVQGSDTHADSDVSLEYPEDALPYIQPILDEFVDAQATLDDALEHQHFVNAAIAETKKRHSSNGS